MSELPAIEIDGDRVTFWADHAGATDGYAKPMTLEHLAALVAKLDDEQILSLGIDAIMIRRFNEARRLPVFSEPEWEHRATIDGIEETERRRADLERQLAEARAERDVWLRAAEGREPDMGELCKCGATWGAHSCSFPFGIPDKCERFTIGAIGTPPPPSRDVTPVEKLARLALIAHRAPSLDALRPSFGDEMAKACDEYEATLSARERDGAECPTCGGDGYVHPGLHEKDCPDCNGSGRRKSGGRVARDLDFAELDGLASFFATLNGPHGAYSIKVDALARQLPHLLACAKFVEEHGEKLDAALRSYEGNALAIQHLHDDGPAHAKGYAVALEALRRLSRESGGTGGKDG